MLNLPKVSAPNDVVTTVGSLPARVFYAVKRLDFIHPELSGNKYFKLKYNLEAVMRSEHKTLLTFGGAWSNHIHATAAAGRLFDIKTIGMIRGEEPSVWSETLKFAAASGMQLEFISRLAYAEKDTEDFKGWLHEQYGAFHLVPEGGSNFLGINGCMEILDDKDKETFDYVCCAAGTGATAAGLLLSMASNQRLVVFPALKGGEFVRDEIRRHVQYFLMGEEAAASLMEQVVVIPEFHFGGYGKWTPELLQWMEEFYLHTGVLLDQVYTGKMFYGIDVLMGRGFFPSESKVLAIHSGGLQGRSGLGA